MCVRVCVVCVHTVPAIVCVSLVESQCVKVKKISATPEASKHQRGSKA